MKQTLTYHAPALTSTASKINVEAFDQSVELFDNKEYQQSLYALLDYINPEIRSKYGNASATEFNIPHGSIVVNIKLSKGQLLLSAPFLAVPDKGKVPLLRQIASLNTNVLDLPAIRMRDDKLFFEYECSLSQSHPSKIYDILYDICNTGDKYDDEFATKFGALRIYEPQTTPYAPETINRIYNSIQTLCKECLEGIKGFEADRKFGYAWNILSTTLLQVMYFAHPQGQLLNDLDKALREIDREDIPQPEVLSRGKEFITKLQQMSCETLSESFYFVETFVSGKRKSNLKNIQKNFESTFEDAGTYLESEDSRACCVLIINKFYEMYHYNNVQDDVNAVVAKALSQSSAKPWEEAAPILHRAMEKIMEDELEEDDMEDLLADAMQGIDMQAVQQMQQAAMAQAAAMQSQMQQAMQGINMEEYMKNMQNMMASMLGGTNKENETK